jgi:hypothetical protein
MSNFFEFSLFFKNFLGLGGDVTLAMGSRAGDNDSRNFGTILTTL